LEDIRTIRNIIINKTLDDKYKYFLDQLSDSIPLGNSNNIIARLYADCIINIWEIDSPFSSNKTVSIEWGSV